MKAQLNAWVDPELHSEIGKNKNSGEKNSCKPEVMKLCNLAKCSTQQYSFLSFDECIAVKQCVSIRTSWLTSTQVPPGVLLQIFSDSGVIPK